MSKAVQEDSPVPRRRADTDARVSAAVLEQLSSLGYQGLTIEGVARQSGVAKTTIYRRWQSKAEMVFDLVIHRGGTEGITDSGSLSGDIETLAGRVVELIAVEPGRSALPGLLADMAGDPDLASRLQQSVVSAVRSDIVAMIDRAVSRGEVEKNIDVDDLYAALLGVPYVHVRLLGHVRPDSLRRELSEVLLTLLGAVQRSWTMDTGVPMAVFLVLRYDT